jgi:hypothetical protein
MLGQLRKCKLCKNKIKIYPILMEFVWNYEIFSKTRGYHKSMALLVFRLSTYLCTCAWVWLGSKL